MTDPIDRRRFIVLGGMTALAACTSNDEGAGPPSPPGTSPASTDSSRATGASATTRATEASPTTAGTDASASASSTALAPLGAAEFDPLGVCSLLAATAAGPFPNRDQLDRRDVTEGYPGHPVRLGLRVVDEGCSPVPGAVVEIWHADATGDYSSFTDNGTGKDEGEGTTFLRGFQTAGDDGVVEFHTIYPGWYPGRAVHIHLRVHVAGTEVLTSQLFFDDAYSERVFTEPPYAEFGPQDTTNDRDGIAGRALTTGGLLTLAPGATAAGEGTIALTNLGVGV